MGLDSIIKSGPHTAIPLGNGTFSGCVRVAEGPFEIGDDGTSSSLGNPKVTVDADAALVFHRSGLFAILGLVRIRNALFQKQLHPNTCGAVQCRK